MNTHRNLVILALGTLIALLATSPVAMALGEDTDTESGVTVAAKIVQAITITKDGATGDMNFGSIVTDADGGTVALSAASSAVRTATGITLGTAAQAHAAKFTVAGETGAAYTILLPDDVTVTIDDGGAGDAMDVTTFVSSPAEGNNGLLTGGSEILYVGATLVVNSAQLAGTYTGTFDVTVTYY